MKFGDRLKSERKAQKISQALLAEKVGCSQPAIWKLEKNSAEASAYADKISKILGVNLEWLLTGEGPKQRINQPTGQSISIKGYTIPNTYDPSLLGSLPILEYAEIVNWKSILSAHLDGTKKHNREFMLMPAHVHNKSNCFYLSISDNSNHPHLLHGDLMLVDTSKTPQPADFVLAIGKHGPMVGKLRMERDESYTAVSIDEVLVCKITDDFSNVVGVKAGSYRDGSK